jgi:uncharacterized protein YjiS (DUF1127 family)
MQDHYVAPASRPDRDAAKLDHIVLVALTADIATDLAPDHDAGAPPATWARRISRLVKHCWRVIQEQRQRDRLRVALCHMSERELMDIGVTRTEIDCIAAHRAVDRLRDGTDSMWTR